MGNHQTKMGAVNDGSYLNPGAVHKALLEAPSHQVINLLTSGFEKEDKRQIREAETTRRLEAPKAMFRKLLKGKTDKEGIDQGGQSNGL